MIADWAIHFPKPEEGRPPMPHAHILVTCRSWRRNRQNTGWRNDHWLASHEALRRLEDRWLERTGFEPVTAYEKGAA